MAGILHGSEASPRTDPSRPKTLLTITLLQKPSSTNVVKTALAHGTGALNIEGCRIPVENPLTERAATSGNKKGRRPTNLILIHNPKCDQVCRDSCPCLDLDQQSGILVSRSGKPRKGQSGDGWGMTHTGTEYDDIGGASKFFYKIRLNKLPLKEGSD